MHSCIYAGQVRHRRFEPKLHTFRYSLFMVLLDLAELPQLFDQYWLWSSKKPAPVWFRRQDYLGDPNTPLPEAVRSLVQGNTGKRPLGPIRLLTQMRSFGYSFNPVSFYYCFDPNDQYVETIVAEVNNTPWGERFCYVLGEEQNLGSIQRKHYQTKKRFHVSPFMEMDMEYSWHLKSPGKKLTVHIENYQSDTKLFDATLSLKRSEISSASLALMLSRYPFMTLKVISAIYYQALRLWLKKIPLQDHPSEYS